MKAHQHGGIMQTSNLDSYQSQDQTIRIVKIDGKERHLAAHAPNFNGDTVNFVYEFFDSDEGSVSISYRTHSGCEVREEEDHAFDVEVTTGSDVWGIDETVHAIRCAYVIHKMVQSLERYSR
jgi:hypothetical protein